MLSHNALRELFPVNDPMTGHTVPGQAKIYHTKLASYHDNTLDAKLGRKAFDPVKQHMSMGDNQTAGHPRLRSLMAMLKKGSGQHAAATRLSEQLHMDQLKARMGMGRSGAQLGQGYSRVTEDLSWRGRTAQNAPQPHIKAV